MGEIPLWAFPCLQFFTGGNAMFINSGFCLSGTGYLYDILHKNEDVYARINVINPFNSASHHSDEVWIDCVVNDDHLLHLILGLKNHLRMQKIIVIQFDAEYSSFDYCHSGITDEDPDHIVHLKGRLQNVREYLINGNRQNDKHSVQSKDHLWLCVSNVA